ncbi:MAG: tRNA-splicing endonuclease subunit [Alyxoria varia]|nr:MAG: tRNA-splicing endonuclease subunit [Alyxoria varia]
MAVPDSEVNDGKATAPSESLPPTPRYPIPISRLANSRNPRYLVYHAPTISHLRRAHNIPGILVGTLPQSPSQNVFHGLPLELMPEEARMLVEKGLGFVVDEADVHKKGMGALGREGRRLWRERLASVGKEIAKEAVREKENRKEMAMKSVDESRTEKVREERRRQREEQSLANESPPEEPNAHEPSREYLTPSAITPTISYPPLTPPTPELHGISTFPTVNSSSYSLYRHLHAQSYFLSPGLRFGCQYLAYPGDPLRFHSHFLVVGRGWDEEVDLLTLVGGGRLGTGVKKGFLFGGKVEHSSDGNTPAIDEASQSREVDAKATVKEELEGHDGDVRCFCIEWGGM